MASNYSVRNLFSSFFRDNESRRRKTVQASHCGESLEARRLLTLDVPVLNSLGGAPVTLYLDFDGHTETDAGWASNNGNQPIVTPAFDLDGDTSDFSGEELRRMEEIWYRVSEDFSLFNVNVSTVEPAAIRNFESIRVVIGGDGGWIPGAGGVAFLNAFSNGASNTCFAFPSRVGFGGHNVATVISHEAGHTFGLNHQSEYDANGNKLQDYYGGTPFSAPIMGVGYGTNRDTWWRGPTPVSVTNIQDDMAVMTRRQNRVFNFRPDDFGNSVNTATPLFVNSANLTIPGVLEQNSDADVMRFETNTGDISFAVNGLDLNVIYPGRNLKQGTNLDAILRLYDSSGNLIAEDAPTNALSASLAANVSAGVYYIEVASTNEYGAIGQYTLTGNVIPLPTTPTMLAPTGTLPQPLPVFQWTVGANADYYELEVDDLTRGGLGFYKQNVTGTLHEALEQFPEGDFVARVRTVAPDGSVSDWSEDLAFSIDVPLPGIPQLIRPTGEVGSSFPTFEWTTARNAAVYQLFVRNAGTGERVIYKTNYIGNTYKHFDSLADGTYLARVRAGNSVGELSEWSQEVEFIIDSPPPESTQLTAPFRFTTSVNPRFVWDPAGGAAFYDLWVNNDSTGEAQYLRKTDLPGSSTFYDPTRFEQGTYTAWIRAVNGNGDPSIWSQPLVFTVDVLPPNRTRMTGPTASDGSSLITTLNPTFEWEAADRAVRYDLWVNNLSTAEYQIVRRDDITDLSFTSLSDLTQGNYRAWVRGINSAGEVAPWSQAYSFVIDEPTPLKPTIVAPVSNPAGSVDVANPTFVWEIDTDAPAYEFELYLVDSQTGDRSLLLSETGLTEKSYTVPNNSRLSERTYIARVRGVNNSGDVGNWSDELRIRIDVPNPVTPRLISPGGSINDSTPTFRWTHHQASFRYELLIRDLERDEMLILQVRSFQLDPTGSDAVYTLPDSRALGNGTYRYWARSFNSLGEASNWSDSGVFVIQAATELPQAEQQLAALPESLLGPTSPRVTTVEAAEQSDQVVEFSPEVILAERTEQADQMTDLPTHSEAAHTTQLIDEALLGIVSDPNSELNS